MQCIYNNQFVTQNNYCWDTIGHLKGHLLETRNGENDVKRSFLFVVRTRTTYINTTWFRIKVKSVSAEQSFITPVCIIKTVPRIPWENVLLQLGRISYIHLLEVLTLGRTLSLCFGKFLEQKMSKCIYICQICVVRRNILGLNQFLEFPLMVNKG